jgi:hypothetical protein
MNRALSKWRFIVIIILIAYSTKTAQNPEIPHTLYQLGDEAQSGDIANDAFWLSRALRRELAFYANNLGVGEGTETGRGEFSDEGLKAQLVGSDPKTSDSTPSSHTETITSFICRQCDGSFATQDHFTYGPYQNLRS